MAVQPKRVKKIPSPLLIIGLGGTGSDALITIMDKFNRRYELPVTAGGDILDTPERTAYLALDTDVLELRGKQCGNMKLNPENIFPLVIPSKLGAGALPEYITDWWDESITGYEIKNGAGGIRQAGRFVLFHNVDAIVDKLKTVIHSLLATTAGSTMGTLEIVLTTGISGGTGSGSFLDMAYLIRHIMDDQYPNVDYNFMAYILMPPVNVDKIPNITQHKKNMLESTGFAALKELDFWMNYETHKYPFTQRYSEKTAVEWNKKPFDHAVLMGDATVDGDIIVDAYNNCMDVLSESVVNFFAHETVSSDGQISLRSHLSNVVQQSGFLTKTHPANYTYMTVGAAVSDSLQEEMETYESDLVYKRISELREVDSVEMPGSLHSAPLLGKREGDVYWDQFLPPSTDYFATFRNVMPDADVFSDPTWTPQVIYESQPVHQEMFGGWSYNCALAAEKFAVEEAGRLRARFYELLSVYATDLKYGPFTVCDYLKNTENGFVGYFHNTVESWSNQEHTIESERNNTSYDVANILYPKAQNISLVARKTGLWGPVNRYFERCQDLFTVERDYQLARFMARELKNLEKEIKAYSETILPWFCSFLAQKGAASEKNTQAVDQQTSPLDIASPAKLKAYIQSSFGSTEQDEVAVKVISQMLALSQQVQLSKLGTLTGMEELEQTFADACSRFVSDAGKLVNGLSMDHLIDIMLPQETDQRKVEHISQEILPKLKKAARTMLPLKVTNASSDQYIPYAYVSIPDNARLIRDGVKAYQAMEHITPKYSEVSDKIYWLNTFNCVPLFMYTDLPRLEKAYSDALSGIGVRGLHLVQTSSGVGVHTLRHDWSMLPSPVVHKLEKVEPPVMVATRQKAIASLLEESLRNGAATLEVAPNGKEQLNLRLRMENGRPETMDQFERKLNAIVNDASLTPEGKLDRLNALKQEGGTITKEYVAFTQKFAEAEGLRLGLETGTDEDRAIVAANKETARRSVAEYVLYSWYPHIAEQMISQKEMFNKLTAAVDDLKKNMVNPDELQAFVKQFLLLDFSDVFTFGRTSIKYKNFRGEEETLFDHSRFSFDELTVFKGFCPEVVLLSILSNSKDERINPHDREYLLDKAAKLEKAIDTMSDADYAALQEKAKAFIAKHAQTADAIRYDKGDLPKPMRDRMISLLETMRKSAMVYA